MFKWNKMITTKNIISLILMLSISNSFLYCKANDKNINITSIITSSTTTIDDSTFKMLANRYLSVLEYRDSKDSSSLLEYIRGYIKLFPKEYVYRLKQFARTNTRFILNSKIEKNIYILKLLKGYQTNSVFSHETISYFDSLSNYYKVYSQLDKSMIVTPKINLNDFKDRSDNFFRETETMIIRKQTILQLDLERFFYKIFNEDFYIK